MGTKRYKLFCGRKFVLVKAGKIALRGGFWGLEQIYDLRAVAVIMKNIVKYILT
jgi:hypothetical protein